MDTIRLLVVIAAVVVLAVASMVVGLVMFQRRLIYPLAFDMAAIPADRRVPGVAQVTIETADGERLFALWKPPRPGCGVVLTFPGNASLPEWAAARFADGPWRAHGWGVLALAYRGYPGSTGSPSEVGLIADADAALHFVRQSAPTAPILLHGHSLGAAVAVATSSKTSHLGLYLEAPFDSLLNLVRIRYPLLPTALLRDSWRSDLRIADETRPVLVVHGDADPVIPARLAEKLVATILPNARVEILPGDHVSILGVRDGSAEAKFRSRIACEAGAITP
ncbi:MAG: alpha/beta hydrolase [Methylobacterium sp.]|uniref:alpha/beta hydrolase n=1 Tax=Methylobacterium sp. TaxID=409 RepID=UPI0025CE9536|nr:alpha/beta hydrolase [Methylobacterium sp.]MBX9932416.1 alpha/beta hydrolase [Methylobacterium sp.]